MAFHHVYKLLSVNIVHAWMKKLWIQSSLHCTCKAKITLQWFFIKWNNKSRARVRGALSNCGGWEAFLLCAQPFYARSAVEYKLKRRHAFTGLPHFCEKVHTLILLLCCSLLKFSVILSGAVGNFFFHLVLWRQLCPTWDQTLPSVLLCNTSKKIKYVSVFI